VNGQVPDLAGDYGLQPQAVRPHPGGVCAAGPRIGRHDRPGAVCDRPARHRYLGVSAHSQAQARPGDVPSVLCLMLLCASPLCTRSGWPDSNRRPPAPKAGALAKLRYSPYRHLSVAGGRRTRAGDGRVRWRMSFEMITDAMRRRCLTHFLICCPGLSRSRRQMRRSRPCKASGSTCGPSAVPAAVLVKTAAR
jgi:hypothetical protein